MPTIKSRILALTRQILICDVLRSKMKRTHSMLCVIVVVLLSQASRAQYHDDESTQKLLTERGVDWNSVRTNSHTKALVVSIGSPSPPSRFSDLSYLSLTGTKVSDLRPLQGLPLQVLKIDRTAVTDLSPLKGMPLRHLHVCPKTAPYVVRLLPHLAQLEAVVVVRPGVDPERLSPDEFKRQWNRTTKGIVIRNRRP